MGPAPGRATRRPTPARRSRRRPTRRSRRTRSTARRPPTARALGSDAVDFFPFRNGPQSDPQHGRVRGLSTCRARSTTPCPASTLTTDKATYHRGDNVDADRRRRATTSASAASSFYDGPWMVGSADRKPYAVEYTLPTDIACAHAHADRGRRGLLRPDELGVEARSRSTRRTAPRRPGPPPQPSVTTAVGRVRQRAADAPDEPAATSSSRRAPPPASSRSTSSSATTRICTLTATPFTCRVRPTGADVGIQELRAVVTDHAGNTGADDHPGRGAALQGRGR